MDRKNERLIKIDMKRRIQAKLTGLIRRIGIVIFAAAALLLLESSFGKTSSFAIIFDSSKVSYEHSNPSSVITANSLQIPAPQKSRAPEPSTLFLILSGAAGILVRFVRRSFDKFKRVLDIILSIIGIVFASPVLFIAAILVRLESRGPVIYKQNRVGKGGSVFKIFKLRTMYYGAESSTGAVWAKKDDPRITSIGRLLRKTHVDEIPQLLNVLNGEMSIVGPRPERPELVRDLKELVLDYEKRLLVKPGITGLAQVRHKYDETIEDVKKKIKYDLLYIKKMCLLGDLRILANTFIVVFSGKDAR